MNLRRNKISICLATYNGEQFIEDQLKSVLNQLNDEDEIIISDDSSTDKTVALIHSIADSRIKLLPDQKFKNPVGNFENALKHATGDFIFLCDQDDVWMENKVNSVIEKLQTNDLVLHNCMVTDSKLNSTGSTMFDQLNSKKGFIRNLIKNTYIGCCMAFKKPVLKKALPFPKGIPMHDQWIGLIAEAKFKVCFINEPLIYYRRHENNASSTAIKSTRPILVKLSDRLKLLKSLAIRLF